MNILIIIWPCHIKLLIMQNQVGMLKSFTEHFVLWGAIVSLLTAESDINYSYPERCLFEYLPSCERLS